MVRLVYLLENAKFHPFSSDLICSPAGEPLNDSKAGTGTSTTDWIVSILVTVRIHGAQRILRTILQKQDLVVGEGGVIDWISPGWRGEYKK